MNYSKFIVDFSKFSPTFAGNGFVFNAFSQDLLELASNPSANQTSEHANGFYPASLLPTSEVVRNGGSSSAEASASIAYNPFIYPCYAPKARGVITGSGPGHSYAIRGSNFYANSRELVDSFNSPTASRVYDIYEYVEPVYGNLMLVNSETGDEFYEIITSGYWIVIQINTTFDFSYNNTVSGFVGTLDYILYPGFTQSIRDEVSSSSTFSGEINIINCADYLASEGVSPMFRPIFTGQGTTDLGDRYFPIVANTEGVKLLCLKMLGGSVKVDIENPFLVTKESGSKEEVTLTQIHAGNPDILYKFFNQQPGLKPQYLSYVGDRIYIALDEFQEIDLAFRSGATPDRPYFRANSSVALYQSNDSALELKPSQESVASLQIPSDLTYGADFRVDDISFFR